MINGIGALVVSNKFFDSLPADLQEILVQTGRETGERLIVAARLDNEKSLGVLKKEGLTFVMDPATVNRNELIKLRDDTAAEMIKIGYISGDVYQRTRSLVDDFRNNNPDLYTAGRP